jgi:tryptophan synthase alpha chain
VSGVDTDSAPAGATHIHTAVRAANDDGRAALVIYLPAGFPDMATSRACLEAAVGAGADVLEVGFPFSDPIMDGPTIQMASQAALDQGYGVDDDLAMCAELTATVDVPVLTMTYYTIPDRRGVDRFAEQCVAAGLTGAILPDLPADEAAPWTAAAQAAGLGTVFLASSVSTDERLAAIGAASTAFVYATGLLGVTGVKDVAAETEQLVGRIRPHTDAPVCVGVGIKTPQHARDVAAYADGVIVGSAVVSAAADGDPAGAPERVAELVAALREGCVR